MNFKDYLGNRGFSDLFTEANISSKKTVFTSFTKADMNTPFVQNIIKQIATKSGRNVTDVTAEIQEKLDNRLASIANSDSKLSGSSKDNAVESILFSMLDYNNTDFDLKKFKYMVNAIIAKNKSFLRMKNPVNGKIVRPNIITTPAPPFIKQPDWVKDVTTAAASAKGDLIFNINFAKQLIAYADAKGIEAKGGMYESNGGIVPDSYAYLEFLILHELYHIVHADHFYGNVNLKELICKIGPIKYGKYLKSKGWDGSTDPNSNLCHLSAYLSGDIQNFLGDFIINYNLVKNGYPQIPIGLFSEEFNYDKFDSMKDLQLAILDSYMKAPNDVIDDMKEDMDDHLDDDNNNQTKDDQAPPPPPPPQDGDPQDGQDGEPQDSQGGEPQDGQDEEGGEPQDGQGGEDGEPQDVQSGNSQSGNSQDGDPQDGGSNSNGRDSDDDLTKEEKDAIDKAIKETLGEDGDDLTKKMEQAMKEYDSKAPLADDNLSKEEIDDMIKNAKDEAKKDEQERLNKRNELNNSSKARLGNSLTNNSKIQAINWEKLISNMIPKPLEYEDETRSKINKRSGAQMAIAKNGDMLASKPGITKYESGEQSLLFILDNSGSMSDLISSINKEIIKLIDKNLSTAIKSMWVITFDSQYKVYKIDLDFTSRKDHKYRELKDPKKILKAKDINELDNKSFIGKAKDIKHLFNLEWGGGTVFPEDLGLIIKKFLKEDYNQVLFTDSDITTKENVETIKSIMKRSKKPYAFNVILDTRDTMTKLVDIMGGTYKYMSYVNSK